MKLCRHWLAEEVRLVDAVSALMVERGARPTEVPEGTGAFACAAIGAAPRRGQWRLSRKAAGNWRADNIHAVPMREAGRRIWNENQVRL